MKTKTILIFTICIAAILIYRAATRTSTSGAISSARVSTTHESYELPDGYHAYPIELHFDNGSTIKNVGTYITADAGSLKVDYITKPAHPDFFVSADKQHINFETIKNHFIENKKVPVMIAAAAFTPDNATIQGIAFEDGVSVGSQRINRSQNGLLLIKNSQPQLSSFSEISDTNTFLNDVQRGGYSLFQQMSYIRPGGSFSSNKPDMFELRFFVQGELNGTPSSGIIDFTIPLTYTQAHDALANMTGLTITRAIGLDTGAMSEAYLYDARGREHVLYDNLANPSIVSYIRQLFVLFKKEPPQSIQNYRSAFTNVIVLYK